MGKSRNIALQTAPTAQAVPPRVCLGSGSAPCKAQALRDVQTLPPLRGSHHSNCAQRGNDLILQAPSAFLS
jgi:hypothetical protein